MSVHYGPFPCLKALRAASVSLVVKSRKTSSAKREQRNANGDRSLGKSSAKSSQANWRNAFGIDARSLALFRLALGALLLVDLAVRATDLNVMYTDDGMFSRAEICRRA